MSLGCVILAFRRLGASPVSKQVMTAHLATLLVSAEFEILDLCMFHFFTFKATGE